MACLHLDPVGCTSPKLPRWAASKSQYFRSLDIGDFHVGTYPFKCTQVTEARMSGVGGRPTEVLEAGEVRG